MDGLTLLRAAAALGLRVHANGDRLVVRGPKSAAELAQLLLAHKAELVAALRDRPKARLWPLEAAKVFRDQLGAARGRGLCVAPGTEAWERAVRAARRAAAGIPAGVEESDQPGTLDHLLAAFEPASGLKCTAVKPRAPKAGQNDGPGRDLST